VPEPVEKARSSRTERRKLKQALAVSLLEAEEVTYPVELVVAVLKAVKAKWKAWEIEGAEQARLEDFWHLGEVRSRVLFQRRVWNLEEDWADMGWEKE